MMTVKESKATLGLTELVLRGKTLEQMQYTKGEMQEPLQIHVIWGRYGDEEIPEHIGYGLQFEGVEGVIRRITDLSTDAFAISLLADRMNRYQISRYHIDDVIQDFLAV